MLGAMAEWCSFQLGSGPVEVLFEAGHLARVIGLRLTDGREVVLKVRPHTSRLPACARVQRSLFEAGYPCPEPLAGPALLGDMVATAEAHVPGGNQLASGRERAAKFAKALAKLVELAPSVSAVGTLDPPPPWAWPEMDRPWPPPDDMDADLNGHRGPNWLDALADRVRRCLLDTALPPVVGHVDFESQNLRWVDGKIHAVHDWDSVAALPEPAVAGLASAVFTASGSRLTDANVEESSTFLSAYQELRRIRWSPEESAVAWAAGLWVRVFNAKKAYVQGDDSAGECLRTESEARLGRLSATP